MKTMIHIDEVKVGGPVNRLLKQKARRFARHVEGYEKGPGELRVRLTRDGDYSVVIDLDAVVNGSHLHVTKSAPEPSLAIKEGMGALRRLFDKDRVRKNPRLRRRLWSRQKRLFHDPESWRDYIGRAAATPDFAKVIEEQWPRLLFLVTTELAQRIANGDIEAGVIDPVEILDEVIAVDWPAINADAIPMPVFSILSRDALRLLDKKIEEWNEDADRFVSTETEIHEDDVESDLEDDTLDFWIPDGDLVMADVIADPATQDPEEIVANKEARRVLFSALTKLPRQMRLAFAASIMDDQNLDDVSYLLGRSPQRASALIAEAKERLSEALSTEAYAFSTVVVEELYRGLGNTFRVDLTGVARVH